MQITPLHSPEPTFLRLTKFEWAIFFLVGVFIPLFLQSLLALFGVNTRLPILICGLTALTFAVVLYMCKEREQDFLMTFFVNRIIPDVLEGTYYQIPPARRESDGKESSGR